MFEAIFFLLCSYLHPKKYGVRKLHEKIHRIIGDSIIYLISKSALEADAFSPVP